MLQLTLNQQEAPELSEVLKLDDVMSWKWGSCYKIDFDKQEFALSRALPLELRLSHLSRI